MSETKSNKGKLSVEYWREKLNDPSIDQVYYDGKDYHLVRNISDEKKEKIEMSRRFYESDRKEEQRLMKIEGLWGEKVSEEQLAQTSGSVHIDSMWKEQPYEHKRVLRIEFIGDPTTKVIKTNVFYNGDTYTQDGGRYTIANDLIIAALQVLDCPSPYLVAARKMGDIIKTVKSAKDAYADLVAKRRENLLAKRREEKRM